MQLKRAAEGNGDRSIPSLDGLRAFSVLSVILGHIKAPALDGLPFLLPFRHGDLGVAMFFVISGFLITHLLLQEQNKTGRINLRAFYLRRTLRIFPPFYVYVAIVAMMAVLRVYSVPPAAFFLALTYTWNLGAYSGLWIFGHLWSLSLEEQFYLFWPSFVRHLGRATNLRSAALLFCFAPLIRVVAFFVLPPYYQERLHTTLFLFPDHFLAGCILALALDSAAYDGLFRRFARIGYAVPAALYLYVIDPYLYIRYRAFRPLVGYTAEALCIGVILIFVVLQPRSLIGRLLNVRPVRHLGMISYSLYLWQQMFTGPDTGRFVPFPANAIAIFLCAEASYWLIERPAQALKQKLAHGRTSGHPAALAVRTRPVLIQSVDPNTE